MRTVGGVIGVRSTDCAAWSNGIKYVALKGNNATECSVSGLKFYFKFRTRARVGVGYYFERADNFDWFEYSHHSRTKKNIRQILKCSKILYITIIFIQK